MNEKIIFEFLFKSHIIIIIIGAKLFYGGPRRELIGKKEDVFVRRFPLSLAQAERGQARQRCIQRVG